MKIMREFSTVLRFSRLDALRTPWPQVALGLIDAAIAAGANSDMVPPVGAAGILPGRPVLVRGLQLAAFYFAAAAGCILLTRYGAAVAPIWLASPILTWVLINAERRDWPFLIACAAAAHLAANIVAGEPGPVVAVYLFANMADALVAAALLRWQGDTLAFRERDELLRFIAICGIAAPAASVAVLTAGSAIGGFSLDWPWPRTWFLSIGLGFILFLPIVKAADQGNWRALWRPNRRLYAVALFAGLAGLCVTACLYPTNNSVLLYVMTPILVLIAFETGLAGVEIALAFVAALLLSFAWAGYNPIFWRPAPHDMFLALQALIATNSIAVLPLAAALEEKQRAYEEASGALDEAREAWGGLLAAEAHFQLIADHAQEMILRLDAGGAILFASPACDALGHEPIALEGTNFFSHLPDTDAALIRGAMGDLVSRRVYHQPESWRFHFRDNDGKPVSLDAHATLSPPADDQEIVLVLRAAG